MNHAPWSDIGRIQQELNQVKNDLRNKPNSYEISSINSKLDSLERAMRELGSTLTEIQYRLQELEEDKIII
jgi:peptidoglycan hydrolase CwlO-like protein